jgi:hypothetical protein
VLVSVVALYVKNDIWDEEKMTTMKNDNDTSTTNMMMVGDAKKSQLTLPLPLHQRNRKKDWLMLTQLIKKNDAKRSFHFVLVKLHILWVLYALVLYY